MFSEVTKFHFENKLCLRAAYSNRAMKKVFYRKGNTPQETTN